LDIVEPVLLVGDSLFQFIDFILQAPALPFSQLLQVLLALYFFVFIIYLEKG